MKLDTLYLQAIKTNISMDIFINPEYRKFGYGQKLLTTTEQILITKYNVDCINLTVQNNAINTLVDFYERYGYSINNNAINQFYNDGVDIFDMIPMSKKIIRK